MDYPKLLRNTLKRASGMPEKTRGHYSSFREDKHAVVSDQSQKDPVTIEWRMSWTCGHNPLRDAGNCTFVAETTVITTATTTMMWWTIRPVRFAPELSPKSMPLIVSKIYYFPFVDFTKLRAGTRPTLQWYRIHSNNIDLNPYTYRRYDGHWISFIISESTHPAAVDLILRHPPRESWKMRHSYLSMIPMVAIPTSYKRNGNNVTRFYVRHPMI